MKTGDFEYETGLMLAGGYQIVPSYVPAASPYYLNRQVVSNTAPLGALNDNYNVSKKKPLTVSAPSVLANDFGTKLQAILVSSPAHGTVALNANGAFTYTPTAGFTGQDSFIYEANNGSANSNLALVTLHVINHPPQVKNQSYTALDLSPLTVSAAKGLLVGASDPDGDPLTAVLVGPPSHGTVVVNPNGSFTYTAIAGYVGTDSFKYAANDGMVNSPSATVTIIPAISISTTSLANWTVNQAGYNQTVLASGGSGALTYSVSQGSLPQGLFLNAKTGAITGTPIGVGASNFTISVSDPIGDRANQAYTVTINPDPSVLTSSLSPWTQDQPGYKQVIATAGGTGPLQFHVTSGSLPTGLYLDPVSGTIAGIPTAVGTFAFTVTVSDSSGASASAAYQVTINGVRQFRQPRSPIGRRAWPPTVRPWWFGAGPAL